MHSMSKIRKHSKILGLESGFTIVELMITVAVVGIFLVVAIPSYTDFIARNRVDVEVQEYRSILTLARSEAIKQNRSVTVSGINNWQDGYVLALASVANLNSTTDPGILRRYMPQDENGITPSLNGSQLSITEITYRATGLLSSAVPVVMEFCSPDTTEDRRITVNVTGRYSSEIFECP